MYRPSMYNKHDESMYAFVELFNTGFRDRKTGK